MSRNNDSIRNTSKNSISKNKNILTFLIIILIIILSRYLIHNNISSKKITAYNADTIDQLKSENDSKIQENSNNDKSIIQDIRYFDQANLVNDNRGVPVLYYHSVDESAANEVTITPEMLKAQLKYIKDKGYVTLTLSNLKGYLLNNSPIPNKSIVITFDDGYMNNYYNAFPILKDFNMVATIFCITSNLDGTYYLSKDAINQMSNYGIDIQSHTVNHLHLDKLTYGEQLTELKKSKQTLESIMGKKVDSIAYPFGDFNDDSIKAAKEAGYTLGFTTKRGLSDRDDNPLKLDRIYISSKYDMNTFKEILSKAKK
ncbi:MAG: polysaccharide deacetylase family protein [Clostridium sp.]|uniref:polysaccharide deacetylase family protein n=1 Tax=Clostridium sp. TaxID=1506 RepID=UPI0025BDC4D8|nr:polysaccharide deacetylase family protein [Clostridium sp.]MCE5221167.1 polysaccharide deacetylase family protein [Clostridium sp.]